MTNDKPRLLSSNDKAQMTNEIQSTNVKKVYDLEERTAKFGESVIGFCSSLPETGINRLLVSQLIRSATSIGANYMEADAAESKKDFNYKIAICKNKKEAKETLHWFRMIAMANQTKKDKCRVLWKEAHELLLIFSSILRKKR